MLLLEFNAMKYVKSNFDILFEIFIMASQILLPYEGIANKHRCYNIIGKQYYSETFLLMFNDIVLSVMYYVQVHHQNNEVLSSVHIL